jgi:hypothetical protein
MRTRIHRMEEQSRVGNCISGRLPHTQISKSMVGKRGSELAPYGGTGAQACNCAGGRDLTTAVARIYLIRKLTMATIAESSQELTTNSE